MSLPLSFDGAAGIRVRTNPKNGGGIDPAMAASDTKLAGSWVNTDCH